MNIELCETVEAIMLESYVSRESCMTTAGKIDKLALSGEQVMDYLTWNEMMDKEHPERDANAESLRTVRDKETGYVDNSTSS